MLSGRDNRAQRCMRSIRAGLEDRISGFADCERARCRGACPWVCRVIWYLWYSRRRWSWWPASTRLPGSSNCSMYAQSWGPPQGALTTYFGNGHVLAWLTEMWSRACRRRNGQPRPLLMSELKKPSFVRSLFSFLFFFFSSCTVPLHFLDIRVFLAMKPIKSAKDI